MKHHSIGPRMKNKNLHLEQTELLKWDLDQTKKTKTRPRTDKIFEKWDLKVSDPHCHPI